MKLYLLRHADAATQAEIDDERTLSKKGMQQSKCVAKFCLKHEIKPDTILASPLIRAQQTAKPVASALNIEIETVPWLIYETVTDALIEHLGAYTESSSIMIVGHEPDFSRLATALTGANEHAIRVRKGSLTFLEVAEFRRSGACLQWSIPAQLM